MPQLTDRKKPRPGEVRASSAKDGRSLERVADGGEGITDLALEQAEGGNQHNGDEGDDERILDQTLAFLLGHNIVHGGQFLSVVCYRFDDRACLNISDVLL